MYNWKHLAKSVFAALQQPQLYDGVNLISDTNTPDLESCHC